MACCGSRIAPRVRDQTTIMHTPREHTTTQTSCGYRHRRNSRHVAGVPENRLPPPPHAARPPPASAPSRQAAPRRVGRGAHRDDATPTPGAADAVVGCAAAAAATPRPQPPPCRQHSSTTHSARPNPHHSASGITREHAKPHQRAVLARRKAPYRDTRFSSRI